MSSVERFVATVGAERRLKDDRVAHKSTWLLQAGLLEDTVQSPRCQIVTGFARDGDPA